MERSPSGLAFPLMLRSGTFSDLAPLALDTHLWFLVVAGASTVTVDQC